MLDVFGVYFMHKYKNVQIMPCSFYTRLTKTPVSVNFEKAPCIDLLLIPLPIQFHDTTQWGLISVDFTLEAITYISSLRDYRSESHFKHLGSSVIHPLLLHIYTLDSGYK